MKEDSQTRRIIFIKENNKINFNTQGTKRKAECITSGRSQFESAAKALAFWK